MGISYAPLLETLQRRGKSWQWLISQGISPRITTVIKRGGNITADTIGRLCKLLYCQPCDIIEYIHDPETLPETSQKEGNTNDR